MNGTLRLSDVLGRTAVEWFEAVAVCRAVTERVIDQHSGRSVPDLHQVDLGADGHLSTSGAAETREPVRRMGQFLQALLTQSDPPVQLRLMVAQATGPTPTFTTLQDFADALGYFERPDRIGVLRRLHARAITAADASVDVPASIDTMAPLHDDPGPSARQTKPVVPVSKRKVALAAMIVVAFASAGWAYWRLGVGGHREDVSAIAVRASDAIGGAVVAGLSKASESVGLGRLASSNATSTPPAAAPAPPVPPATARPARKAPTTTPKRGEASPLLAFDLEAVPPLPSGTTPAAAATAAAANGHEEPPLDEAIYSAADSGVAAPIGVRPQLPRALPADVSREQLGQIELLILPDGTVGSVKLLGATQGIREGMLLSAAKAWTFQPAMKDGRPVSYRKLVWLVIK